MQKKLILNLFIPLAFTCAILADANFVEKPAPPPYDKKTPPAISLSDAYVLALSNVGQKTNEYYCIRASCLEPISGFSSAGGGLNRQGWMFEFSNTNSQVKRIAVFFDKTSADLGSGKGFGE